MRRGLLVPLVACALGACSPEDVPVEPGEPFSLVVIPDIQYVTLGYPQVLLAMTEWVAEQRDARDIAFVLQEGDMTHNNTAEEWQAAQAGFDVLRDVLPFAFAIGNHDLDDMGRSDRANATFGVDTFQGDETWGGSFEPDRIDNAYFTFRAGGADWVVVTVDWEAEDPVYDWVDTVLSDHADHLAIVLTHAYLTPSGERAHVGPTLWKRVLRHHANVRFTFNGHYTGGFTATRQVTGKADNVVHEMFFNMQTEPLGGRGFLRVLTLDPPTNTVKVETYSPLIDLLEPGDDFQFTLTDVDLAPL